MNKLNGKVAVVTGASKGIGASIAEHLAAEGAAVVVNYASSRSGADAVVARITEKGGKAIAIQGDVSRPEDIQRLFSETKKTYGKLDVLVNNAGTYEFAPLEAITPEHIQKQLNLNVVGLLLTTQEAVKLIGPEGGSIVNIGSLPGSTKVNLESGRTGKLLSVELASRRILRSRPHSWPETMLAGSPVKLSLPQAENGCDVLIRAVPTVQ